MIVPLGREHVDQVARLHCETITGLLSRLGRPAALAFYSGCEASGAAVGLVDVEQGVVRGFVLGSMRPSGLGRAALAAHPAGTISSLLRGGIRDPGALIWLARSRGGAAADGRDPRAPELTYLAVVPGLQGEGIGRRLAESFLVALRQAGARACELSVDEGNRGALALYGGLGFREVGRRREFGIRRLRLRLELPPG